MRIFNPFEGFFLQEERFDVDTRCLEHLREDGMKRIFAILMIYLSGMTLQAGTLAVFDAQVKTDIEHDGGKIWERCITRCIRRKKRGYAGMPDALSIRSMRCSKRFSFRKPLCFETTRSFLGNEQAGMSAPRSLSKVVVDLVRQRKPDVGGGNAF